MTTTFTYDAQDQLIRIDHPDATVTTYAYDALGRRIEKDVAGVITRYVYDRVAILLEYDGANLLQARYNHGTHVDQPLAVERRGSVAYYQVDHLGSVRQLTNVAGTVVNSYDYDSYGRIESAVEAIAQPYRFTGREFDSESGNYYYRARYYDPATGRFLSEDPIGFAAGDYNLYRYVFNNPVLLNDPNGRIAPILAVCLVGATVGAVSGAAAAVAKNLGQEANEIWLGGDGLGIIDQIQEHREKINAEARDVGALAPFPGFVPEPRDGPSGCKDENATPGSSLEDALEVFDNSGRAPAAPTVRSIPSQDTHTN